jgi:hypothetical protein
MNVPHEYFDRTGIPAEGLFGKRMACHCFACDELTYRADLGLRQSHPLRLHSACIECELHIDRRHLLESRSLGRAPWARALPPPS